MPFSFRKHAVPAPDLSVVIPVCNEQDNVVPLAREIAVALAGREFEVLFVDDGSTDGTVEKLAQHPGL